MAATSLLIGQKEALDGFKFKGILSDIQPFGDGHINDTYLATYNEDGYIRCYTLQHMNKRVFKNPEQLMENLINISRFLMKKIRDAGGDPHRETLDFIRAKSVSHILLTASVNTGVLIVL